MEIIVASDTHRDVHFVKQLVFKHPHAAGYLHAGDSMVSELSLKPFVTVKGNCDVFIKSRARIIEFGKVNIYLFHGHNYPLDSYLLKNLAEENNCQIIIHGHTHIPRYEVLDGIHILCPGSTRNPRGNSGPSYGIIDISDSGEIKKVEIKRYDES